ncbi:MAG: NAD-binding protein [Candidatus Omnitrophota bacterium]
MYIIIVGCGRVGSKLADLLQGAGHNVVVIDEKPDALRKLGPTFNGITLIGNGCDTGLLAEGGIEKADVFCALTEEDNVNIMAAQIARNIFKIPKAYARVYDPHKADIYKKLGLDVISGTTLFAAMLRDKIMGSHFTGYLIETGELGIIELPVSKDQAGKKVSDLNESNEALISAIVRKKETIIPDADTILQEKDLLMVVARPSAVPGLKKKFKL